MFVLNVNERISCTKLHIKDDNENNLEKGSLNMAAQSNKEASFHSYMSHNIQINYHTNTWL